jgi:hypothetical protein
MRSCGRWEPKPSPTIRFTTWRSLVPDPLVGPASVYAASEGLHTSVIEQDVVGGQASMSSMIRNYFGFPWGIGGSDLTERGDAQATGFGARFVLSRTATALREEDDNRVLTLSNGTEVTSRTVVISTGVAYRRLNVPWAPTHRIIVDDPPLVVTRLVMGEERLFPTSFRRLRTPVFSKMFFRCSCTVCGETMRRSAI